MIYYQKPNVDVRTVYTVEYIDNKRDADYVASGRFNDGDPWERYKQKVFQSADEAFSYYTVLFVREDIYDVKLFEEMYIDGELVREQYIELVNNLFWSIKNAVNREMRQQIESLKSTNEVLLEEVGMYESFIKLHNACNAFREFKFGAKAEKEKVS